MIAAFSASIGSSMTGSIVDVVDCAARRLNSTAWGSNPSNAFDAANVAWIISSNGFIIGADTPAVNA